MKHIQKIYLISVFLVTILVLSCEKVTDDYSNKPFDNNLIGVWKKTYSTRDWDNMITIFTDTLSFKSNNSGDWFMYRFSEPKSKNPFNFYSENNMLHLRFIETGMQNNWTYNIRNDSLIISGNVIFTR